MTCRRIVIIDKGRIVAQDTPEKLTAKLQGSEQSVITVAGPKDLVQQALLGVGGVQRVEERIGDAPQNGVCSFVAFSSGEGDQIRGAMASAIVQHGWSLLEIKPVALSLEDLFMRIVTSEQRPGAQQ
jgi:ABC-2 type transport system ATP-binding protein